MSYKLLSFEKTDLPVNNVSRMGFVALVQKKGEKQPFRVLIENFETAEAAKLEVKKWIATREQEDKMHEEEKARIAEEGKSDAMLDELNQDL